MLALIIAALAAPSFDNLSQLLAELELPIGLIVAAGVALQKALGPAMNAIVEALKSAGLAPEGQAGLVSLGIGTALGLVAGTLAYSQTGEPIWIVVGAVAGLFGLGASGVRSHLEGEGHQAQGEQGNAAAAQKTDTATARAAPPAVGQTGPSADQTPAGIDALAGLAVGLAGNGRAQP
jgi:hypothetical protein